MADRPTGYPASFLDEALDVSSTPLPIAEAARIVKRAAEGGAFAGLDAAAVAERARAIVGELPDGLVIVSGFAEAIRNGWGLAGKLGERVFLARPLDEVREEAEARMVGRRRWLAERRGRR